METQLYIIYAALAVYALIFAATVYAADYDYSLAEYNTTSFISGTAVSGASGKISINLAAGDANVQTNSAAIAVNPNGIASAIINSTQRTATGQGTTPNISIARIGDNAFSNSTGIISVNQASGTGNAQANGFAMAFGIEGEILNESTLSQTISSHGNGSLLPQQQTEVNARLLDVEATAFENSHGIVQLNQTAGSGNATRNNFALRFSLEAK